MKNGIFAVIAVGLACAAGVLALLKLNEQDRYKSI